MIRKKIKRKKQPWCMSNPLEPLSCPDDPCHATSLRTMMLEDSLSGHGDNGGRSNDDGAVRCEHLCKKASSCHTISGNLALDPMIMCKLCLCECKLQEMHQMYTCTCVYCKKCLKQYLMVLTDEGAVSAVTCPDAACKEQGKIEEQEVQQLLGDILYEKFKKMKFQKEIELDPGRAWCPRAGCDTVCSVPEETESEEKEAVSKGKRRNVPKEKRFICPKCGLKFCSVCKAAWHGQKPCIKITQGASGASGKARGHAQFFDILGIQKEDSEEAKIKRCPFCHIPIERDAGCAQMMCKNCQHVFCWYCLANLDNDFLLRHYDKGPCKNKLGHSRTTIIFHRAQIVCVFAGFGFLLLLASPFLLIVAPCILCCKSKWGGMCDDDVDVPES